MCQHVSEGTTNRVRLQEDRFLALEILLPSLEEQQQAVARIEELAGQIHEARNLRQQSAKETDVLFRNSVSALLQCAWSQAVPLSGIIGPDCLQNGKSVKSAEGSDGIKCLTLSSMRQGRIYTRCAKAVPLTLKEAQSFLVRRNDVFIVRGNGSKELCGLTGRVETEVEDVIFPDLFIKVQLPTDRFLPEFFVAVWNSSAIRDIIEETAKTTSGIWKINQGHIASTPMPFPSLTEQRRLVGELNALRAEIDALKRLQSETAAEIEALLPAILDRAFKTEL